MSDIKGTDPQIHGAKVAGVLRELSNIFRRTKDQPTVPEMAKTQRAISRRLPQILADRGAKTPYEAQVFQDLCYEAKVAADSLMLLKS